MIRIREHLFHLIRGKSCPVGVDKICHHHSDLWGPERRIQCIHTVNVMNLNQQIYLLNLKSKSSCVASIIINYHRQISYPQQCDCLQVHWHHLVDKNSLCIQVRSLRLFLEFLYQWFMIRISNIFWCKVISSRRWCEWELAWMLQDCHSWLQKLRQLP